MSQCDAILAVLADGRPHAYREIHDRVGFCRLNSRVAELRARGHRIECNKTGGDFVYQLQAGEVSELERVAEPIVTGLPVAGTDLGATGQPGSGSLTSTLVEPLDETDPSGRVLDNAPLGSVSSSGGETDDWGRTDGAAQLSLLPDPVRRERWAA
jgi:hypothetical protein